MSAKRQHNRSTPRIQAAFGSKYLGPIDYGILFLSFLISIHIQNIFQNFINDPTGALNKPLTYEEVAGVCSNLKPGISGVSLDYERVGYAGPPLCKLLFHF